MHSAIVTVLYLVGALFPTAASSTEGPHESRAVLGSRYPEGGDG
jgi:hypothetical protein